MAQLAEDQKWMAQAIELALRGQGLVEPNPMVGCLILRDGIKIGEGWHQKFGQPHAEIDALASCTDPAGSTVFVTLEPCCHTGKTPPCVQALIDAKVSRVVVAATDPNPHVNGAGIEQLRAAGINVETGTLADEALEMIRPFAKRVHTGTPWVIAKWAMSLDGKIATSSGDSKWISNERSRQRAHEIRGRMDAIMVGIATALADDPLLTARPAGPRTATRIVMDSQARIPLDSQLVRSIDQAPLMIVTGPQVDPNRLEKLRDQQCEVLTIQSKGYRARLVELLQLLGSRDMTNILIEGGGRLLGELNEADLIDEIHCFIAPKIIGGQDASSPIRGKGITNMVDAAKLVNVKIENLDSDVYIQGRIDHS